MTELRRALVSIWSMAAVAWEGGRLVEGREGIQVLQLLWDNLWPTIDCQLKTIIEGNRRNLFLHLKGQFIIPLKWNWNKRKKIVVFSSSMHNTTILNLGVDRELCKGQISCVKLPKDKQPCLSSLALPHQSINSRERFIYTIQWLLDESLCYFNSFP